MGLFNKNNKNRTLNGANRSTPGIYFTIPGSQEPPNFEQNSEQNRTYSNSGNQESPDLQQNSNPNNSYTNSDNQSPVNLQQNTNKNHFCINCGTKLVDGAKFCHSCGATVGEVKQTESQTEEKTDYTERRQEYSGKILKCPNCGNSVTETTAVCPACGFHITGKKAISSVQAFNDELMRLENTKTMEKGLKGILLSSLNYVHPSDAKKVELIKSFPIPNTVDDIMEFMFLATANIDVRLSKGKWNKSPKTEDGYTIKRTISNAWVSKMTQAYQKAELMFPDDPVFEKIQKLYLDKAKELKMIE